MRVSFCSARRVMRVVTLVLVLGALPVASAQAGFREVAEDTGVFLISTAFEVLANIGTWLLQMVSKAIGSVASVGSFVTNPYVTTGWPFLQGLANFGFILALLVIAVTTALRIDIGGGVRRLLPRLLIGALLINFSLLIGGVIIDVSRLLMALFANLAGSEVSELGSNILRQSEIITGVFNVNFDNSFQQLSLNQDASDVANPLDFLVNLGQAVVFVWGLTIAMLIITVTLIIRYIYLLLLLIVSPMVYVAIAFPGAGGLWKKWWQTFLTNVFYGPIAMFALVLLATVGAGQGSFRGLSPIVSNFLGLVITIVLLVVVATSGRKLGVMGANAAIGGVKQLRDPKKAGALAGALAGGPVGLFAGLAAGAGGKYAAKEGGSAIKRGVTRPFRAYSAQRKKDTEKKDKELQKKGVFSRVGTSAAKGVGNLPLGARRPTGEQKAAKKEARAISRKVEGDPANAANAVTAEQLTNRNIAAGLTSKAHQAILDNGSKDQQQALVASLASQKENVDKEKAQQVTVHLAQKIEDAKIAAANPGNTPQETARHEKTAEKVEKQLKAVVSNKAVVDEFDDKTISRVTKSGADDAAEQLYKTLAKQDNSDSKGGSK